MSAELRKNRSAFIHAPILAEIVARLKAGELALAQYLGGKQAGFPRTVVAGTVNSASVPAPGSLWSFNRAPMRFARSWMPGSPQCP